MHVNSPTKLDSSIVQRVKNLPRFFFLYYYYADSWCFVLETEDASVQENRLVASQQLKQVNCAPCIFHFWVALFFSCLKRLIVPFQFLSI